MMNRIRWTFVVLFVSALGAMLPTDALAKKWKASDLNPFKSREPAVYRPVKKNAFQMPNLLEVGPAIVRRVSSDTKKLVNGTAAFAKGTKDQVVAGVKKVDRDTKYFFAKTNATINPWAKPLKPKTTRRYPVTGTRRIERWRKPAPKQSFLGSLFAPKEPEDRRPKSPGDWLLQDRPGF